MRSGPGNQIMAFAQPVLIKLYANQSKVMFHAIWAGTPGNIDAILIHALVG